MSTASNPGQTSVVRRLGEDRPLVAVELRPPRSGMSYGASVDAWIDMYHSIRRLARQDTLIFLTDNAIGQAEEENLAHLTANLAGELAPARIVPFLTAKHSLDYIQLYAARAASHGFEALTVVGGDASGGLPRCFPHAYQLRQWLRRRVPSLGLGGWVNPLRNPVEQVDFVLNPEFAHVAVARRCDARRVRKRQRWPVFYEQLYDSTYADLLLVSEIVEPVAELVGAFDFPRHASVCHIRNNASQIIFWNH